MAVLTYHLNSPYSTNFINGVIILYIISEDSRTTTPGFHWNKMCKLEDHNF